MYCQLQVFLLSAHPIVTFSSYGEYKMPIFYVINSKGEISEVSSLDKVGKHATRVYKQNIRWKKCEWRGPCEPEFAPNMANNLPVELAELLHAFREQNVFKPFSRKAAKTFQDYCFKTFGIKVNLRSIPSNLGFWVTPPSSHQTAIVDGQHVRLINWQLPGPEIGADGIPVRRVRLSDVGPNRHNIGSFWLARWRYKNNIEYTTIPEPFFEDVTHLLHKRTNKRGAKVNTFGGMESDSSDDIDESVDNGNHAQSVDDDDDEGGESDDSSATNSTYASDTDEDEDDGTDDDTDDSDTDDETTDTDDISEMPIMESWDDNHDATHIDHGYRASDRDRVDAFKLEYELYSKHEQMLLPISYMTSRAIEWQYVLAAFKSNFTQVRNLVRVRDFTLWELYTILGLFAIKSEYKAAGTQFYKYIKSRLGL